MESLVSRLHDGELAPDELVRVQQHLPGCAACKATLQAYRRLSAVFDHAEPVRMSPEAELRLRRQLQRAVRWGTAAQLARPVAVAAAMVLSIGLPLLWWAPAPSGNGGSGVNGMASAASSSTASAVPLPTGWEAMFLSRETEPVARDFTQVQFADFVARDLAQSSR